MGGHEATRVVTEALDGLNRALRLKDADFADTFHREATLIGSEASDLQRGREAIRGHLAAIYARPYVVQFDWKSVEIERTGDVVWFFADGELIVKSSEGERRAHYNLTGIIVEGKNGWRWRLFHGSEPLPS